MNFLKRLFSGGEKGYSDPDGIYFYVRCDKCDSKVRLRVHKTHDLNQVEGGFVWHKTIVDSRCFRPMPTVVYLDHNYEVINQEIEGGCYISAEEYKEDETGPALAEDEADIK